MARPSKQAQLPIATTLKRVGIAPGGVLPAIEDMRADAERAIRGPARVVKVMTTHDPAHNKEHRLDDDALIVEAEWEATLGGSPK